MFQVGVQIFKEYNQAKQLMEMIPPPRLCRPQGNVCDIMTALCFLIVLLFLTHPDHKSPNFPSCSPDSRNSRTQRGNSIHLTGDLDPEKQAQQNLLNI